MPRGAYLGNVRAIPSCGRYCTNVCTRLFVVGRNQCIADCLRCAGIRGTAKSKALLTNKEIYKPKGKGKCGCGCGKCK